MTNPLFHFSGIDGDSGAPRRAPILLDEFGETLLQAEANVPDVVKNRRRALYEKKAEDTLGVRFGFHAEDVNDVGWGVIFSPDTPQAVQDALQPLVDFRKGWPPFTWQPGESAHDFRLRHGQDFGVVDPEKLPYYLLIVGPPTDIPFDFQFDLDGEHAVGRLDFANAADYTHYGQRVMAYEDGSAVPRTRRAAFFGPARAEDDLIQQSADHLVTPLHNHVAGRQWSLLAGGKATYQTDLKLGDAAARDALFDLITRTADAPAFLLSATHGLEFASGANRQVLQQGALLCQEWPGNAAWHGGPVPESMFLSGEQIPQDVALDGLIYFAFACFSGGTPLLDSFAHLQSHAAQTLAVDPFSAYLPQRMLAQGALAFIGHVDRAWSYSFAFPNVGFLTGTFEDTVGMILSGYPVGHALEQFNRRYLDANNALTKADGIFDQYASFKIEADQLLHVWTARSDAQSYLLYGDPAVRLRPEKMAG